MSPLIIFWRRHQEGRSAIIAEVAPELYNASVRRPEHQTILSKAALD
jgi:hypothetical protein